MSLATSSHSNIPELTKIDLFRNLKPFEVEEVALAANRRRYNSGEFLFFQGDPARVFYVMVEGRLKLTQVTPDGQQVILRYISPGDAFAVIAVLSGIRYPVSAETVDDCELMAWDQSVMVDLMERYPPIALNAIGILANRVREFQDRLRELSTERVERRIARALLRLVRQTGERVSEGVLIDLPLSRQDLAEMTGTTLYTVSRTLSNWENEGIIKSKRSQVTVLNPHGLVVIAEDLPPDTPPSALHEP